METYYDIHTHGTVPVCSEDGTRVVCLRSVSVASPSECAAVTTSSIHSSTNTFFSVGWHPWHAAPAPGELQESLRQLLRCNNVLAVGEAGLDALRGASMEVQERLFRLQAEMAESNRLPVMIHGVKTMDRLYALHKALRPTTPWILHGFRGKPEQLRQWLRLSGTYVSFGEHFNVESARCCPADRFLLETDESSRSIVSIYKEIARARTEQECHLRNQQWQNWHAIFRSKS